MQHQVDVCSLDTCQLLRARPQETAPREPSECSLCFNNEKSEARMEMCLVCKNSWCFVCNFKMIIRGIKTDMNDIKCPFCRTPTFNLSIEDPRHVIMFLEDQIDYALLSDMINIEDANDLYRMIGNGTRVEVYDEE